MKNLYILIFLLLTSCEKFALERSDVTLSGKYVVSKLDITSVDQNTNRDSLYSLGSTYVNSTLPDPFDSIVINRFYWHMDYMTIRLNELGVSPTGQDIWEYGNSPNEIFYRILNNTTYSKGYLQFDYITKDGSARTMTFYIEDDGLESLQLKSSGAWFKGKFGEKQVMTLYLTRVGP
ncbi:MAG: hypothetical protein RLZZ196_3145 [Bacteroidota bacterium]